ncbi:TrbG/VirB9 family P-type conjugative transfer protein [Sphingorhabdus sp. EL138]|jgi:type IV secretion system protein VirB9|uniref:TrbG/VirB9 family P-type conjugative transfer protein n=1 Tax=Sphingorhabdus sp. EL138 TaxID=2073156 RepID=UPI0025ED2E4E|nr:TrbG/VirB9 family P-type conjugative transfer protein [Sphingorhabdus sp. EL138]
MIRHYLGLALITAAIGAAGTLPIAASAQVASNIRYVDYNPDAIIRLTGHTGYQMMLEFERGEQIETVGIGDSSGWQVTPNGAGTIMFLKPVGVPPATNLSIVTNVRRYNLELLAKSGLRVPQSQIIYAVRFRYPPKVMAADTMATPPPLIATPPELWNRAYSYDGAKANVPEQVFDDGKATYFRFAAGSGAPAIFSITPDAGESIVNFAVRGPYTVVEQIAPQFVLRHGTEVTIIFNDAYAVPTPGADAPKQRTTKKKCGLLGCRSMKVKP